MKRQHTRAALLFALAVVVSSCTDCAGNNPPDVAALQVGGSVLDTATTLQKWITQETDAKAIPVDVAKRLTGYVDVIYTKSGPLGDAVKAYHDLSDLQLKKAKAAEIEQLISEINVPLGQLLKETVPDGVVRQFTLLLSNIMAAVSQVQSTVVADLKK